MKKTSVFLPLVLSLLLPACQRPEEPMPPQSLLSKEQMTSLLADIHVAESQVEAARLSPDSARALFNQRRRELLWKREIDDSAFVKSYQYYAIHNKDLDEIYGAVIDSLSQREARLNGTAPENLSKW